MRIQPIRPRKAVTFTETDEGSRTTAERVICRFRGMQTVPARTAKNGNANYSGYFQVPARASGHSILLSRTLCLLAPGRRDLLKFEP